MKEYAAEQVTGMTMAQKATEIMNRYASQGWIVLRTESIGAGFIIIFERDRQV